MSESEKPEGDLEDADGVTVDRDGNPQMVMEALQKGGSGDTDERLVQKGDTDDE